LFDAGELDEYWAANLDFSLLGGPDPKCIDIFDHLKNPNNTTWKLNVVAFSNGPRKYVCRVLKEIGLDSYFSPENIFAVTDVLPHCKPDKASFEFVLKTIGAKPEETIMVEDSMKNVRAAKALGMRTILVLGRGRRRIRCRTGWGGMNEDADDIAEEIKLDILANEAEASKADDAPDESDPAVDAAVEVVSEIGDVLNLWLKD
jgi:FMN phosphatase YigB (HAD superfamily)